MAKEFSILFMISRKFEEGSGFRILDGSDESQQMLKH